MNVIRWQPFTDTATLRNVMDRFFDDSFFRPWQWTDILGHENTLPVDMYQIDDAIVIKASVPGINSENVEITIIGDTLTIKGETREETDAQKDDYFRRERRYGSFYRNILLPNTVQSDKAEASFENGVLTLTIPKAEEVKPKQIKIKPKVAIEGKK
jgi:HSP20 family protein